MSRHYHPQTVPRAAIIGAAILMAATVAFAAVARSERLEHPEPQSVPVESVEVSFEDEPDGALSMTDPTSGHELTRLAPRSNNFVRGVLRGMYRTRKLESVDHGAAFRLSRSSNGRLSLDDPSTGRRVELDSFGPTNSAAFEALLVAARAKP